MRLAVLVTLVCAFATGGCVYEDDCKNGARRVDGVCTLGDGRDGGADGGPTDGAAADAPRDGGGTDGGGTDGGDDAGDDDAAVAPDPVVEIAVGIAHVCARREMGEVFCWGGDQYGQIGNGLPLTDHAAAVVALGAPAQQLTARGLTTCAKLSDGTVVCWGANWDAMIDDSGEMIVNTPRTVYSEPILSVAAGFANVCVATLGHAYCRGRNDHGEAAAGTAAETTAFDVPVQRFDGSESWPLEALDGIAPADHHVCFLLVDGRLFCAGDNSGGALGDTTNVDRAWATEVDVPGEVDDVATGGNHTCAANAGGMVYCWGYNDGGEIGGGVPLETTETAPRLVAGIADATKVVTGERHACALLGDGTVKCWGWQGNGAIGNGVLDELATDAPYQLPLTGVRQIAAGLAALTCALTDAGEVYCWGQNFMETNDVFRDGEDVHATPVLVSTEP